MSLRFNWSSREEWAKQRTSVDGHQNPNPPSNQLSDYATADEITGAIAALNKVWGDYAREMKSDKAEGGHRYDDFRWYRCAINEAIKELREGKMPRWRSPTPASKCLRHRSTRSWPVIEEPRMQHRQDGWLRLRPGPLMMLHGKRNCSGAGNAMPGGESSPPVLAYGSQSQRRRRAFLSLWLCLQLQ